MQQTLTELLGTLEAAHYTVRRAVPFSSLTSFRTGGVAAVCLSPHNEAAMAKALVALRQAGVPYVLLGHGTNVLAPDEDYDGVVLLTDRMREYSVNEHRLTLAAGLLMNAASTLACQNALSGLEFAYGIPGTTGGALCMNAGAYGHDISEVVESVCVCDRDGKRDVLSVDECGFGYRESVFPKQGLVALSCTLCLVPDETRAIRARMDDYLARRKKSQPLEFPSAGSFFRRPEGYFAGKLIEDAGLKGLTVGGAQVSEKHAGFLINRADAKSRDVRALAAQVQERVKAQFGVTLQREVRYFEEL